MSETAKIVIENSPSLDRLFRRYGKFGESHTDVVNRWAQFYHDHLRGATAFERDGKTETQGVANSPEPLASVEHEKRSRAARGTVTEAEAFIPYILRVLLQTSNHSAASKTVIAEVLGLMKPILTSVDMQTLPKNQRIMRAQNKCMWGRQVAVDRGLLKPTDKSGHGIWALTPKGLREARRLQTLGK